MNTNAIRHLEIEDLLEAVDGAALDETVTAHLATCTECASEVDHWRAVALGVRQMVASVQLPDAVEINNAGADWQDPGHRLAARMVIPTEVGSRRRMLVGTVAAALLLIGGGSYGLSQTLDGGGGGSTRPADGGRSATLAPGLTAVSGCSALAGTSGTLQEVDGSEFVVMTSAGQSVPVTTSSSTNIGREEAGSLGDISDGAQVVVNGTESQGAIAATTVGVGAIGAVKMTPSYPGLSKGGLVAGTVADVGTRGFTVVESNGTHVAVATGSSTIVLTLSTVDVDQLQAGEFTVALGTPNGGTLRASRVEQRPLTTSTLPQPPSTFGMTSPKQAVGTPSGGCSAAAAQTMALMLAS